MFLTELARRIWYFLRRDRLSDDLADEMRLHLELRAQRERQVGADPAAAHWRARRQFGSSVRLVESSPVTRPVQRVGGQGAIPPRLLSI